MKVSLSSTMEQNDIKPRLVLSQCLELEACRYNGQRIPDSFVRKLGNFVEYIPICPEVAIGMGIPRDPVALYGEADSPQMIQPSSEIDYTEKMLSYATSFLSELKDVDGFLFKSRSPSCGTKDVKIYPNLEKKGPPSKGPGLFAGKALELHQLPSIEDEGRLKNYVIRDHFLTQIFTLARWRQVKASNKIKDATTFHAQHKLIFMALNQSAMRTMGRILGDHKKDLKNTLDLYEQELARCFQRRASYKSHVNVLEHALGYFKKELSSEEKAHFKQLIRQYRKEKLPLSALKTLLQSWVIRFNNDYLSSQLYFEPYPNELTEITDSGKGRT